MEEIFETYILSKEINTQITSYVSKWFEQLFHYQ